MHEHGNGNEIREVSVMVTVEMVAKMAGVSRGTVDRVLHHRGEVKSETAERVRQVMRELDFQPNTLGRAFSIAKKRNRIGIFLSAREPDFQEQIKQGMSPMHSSMESKL